MAIDQDIDQLYSAAKTGKLPASSVAPAMSNLAKTYNINDDNTLEDLRQHRAKIEEIAYRNSGNEPPSTPLGAVGQAALHVGIPYGLGVGWNAGKALLGSNEAKMPSLGGTAKEVFTPNFWKDYQKQTQLANEAAAAGKAVTAPSLAGAMAGSIPGTLALPILFSGLRPLSDPLYQRGERGYLKSWWEGMKGSTRAFNRSWNKANREHGLLGVPINALNVFTNPLEATTSAANTLTGGHLIGKEAAYRIKCAYVMVENHIKKLKGV